MAVAGSKIDPARLPSHSDIAFHRKPELASAAINAVGRARLVSYIERGIVHPQSLRKHGIHRDVRDDSCIHLILHRGNCLLGSIRCQFHSKTPATDSPAPLYREMMLRSGVPESEMLHVATLMEAEHDRSPFYMETSGWLSNPDLKSVGTAMILPAAVWGLAASFEAFYGIATLRASNKAAAMLNQMGGEGILHNGREIKFDDPYYRGPVQLMRMHSHRYDPQISPAVLSCAETIAASGIITAS